MAGIYGADVAQLRALAAQFSQAADQLDRGRLQVGDGIRVSAWVGPFAASFRLRWDSEHSLRIAAAARRLRDGAQVLRSNADEQDRASAAESGGGRPSGTGSTPDGARNSFWFWEDGFRAVWSDHARLSKNIKLDKSQFKLDNVDQENVGDCMVLSLLGVMGRADPDYFLKHIRRRDDGSYDVTLYTESGVPVVYNIADEVIAGGVRGADGKQSWMTLYEAALIKAGYLKSDGEYAKHPYYAIHAVTGASGEIWAPGSEGYPTFDELKSMVRSGRPVTVGTVDEAISDSQARAKGVKPLQLVEHHQYMVDKVNADGSIVLVNPWGSESSYAKADGGHRITVTKAQYELYFDNVTAAANRSTWRTDLNVPDPGNWLGWA